MMIVQYERTYEYKADAKEHALLISALQYVSKHEEDGDFGKAVRKLLHDVLCSSEKER